MDAVPTTILAGSDRRATSMPSGGEGLHPLAAYKGAALRVGGRALLEVLVERLRDAGGYGPLSVAGPRATHLELGLRLGEDVEWIETDGTIDHNLRAVLDHHAARGHGRIALLACDVLPGVSELHELARLRDRDGPCALWVPLVRRPSDEGRLGSFAWKPRYAVRVPGEEGAVQVLPGHLGVLEPGALRLDLGLELLGAAYATRNGELRSRSRRMALALLRGLLAADLRRLGGGHPPLLTLRTLLAGRWLARGLAARRLELGRIERRLGRVFLADSHRRDAGTPRGVRFPLVDCLSLAEDVDTQEEADELHLEHP